MRVMHSDLVLPRMLSAVAVAQPERLSLAEGRVRMSYRELDARSNRLANLLAELGVGADVIVGIGLPRSIAFIVAALGVLKAGGAYLPLDPGYPRERLAFMVLDAGVSIVLSDLEHAPSMPIGGARVMALDGEARPMVDNQRALPPERVIAAESLAYVIYTSGSTGQPKAVLIEHKALSNLVDWHQRAFGVTAADRASLVSSPSFDATVWETWPYLAAGASVHLPDDETRLDPARTRDWLLAEDITVSFQPTPVAESMLALEWPPAAALRYLLTGADVLYHYPPAGLPFELVNNYGPTECAVVTTSTIIRPLDQGTRPPPIGLPIDNVQVHVLDENLRPVAPGEIGELCIGGLGLARGYLNRPSETAARFVAGPHSADGDGRLYRTGDLGRKLPDGNLEFLGRSDDQVQIRGHRVELGDVAWALGEHPLVQLCAVAPLGEADRRRLVAYVVPAATATAEDLAPEALWEFLRSRLPEYMIPAGYVCLEALPLTPNGKIDRARLPEPAPRIARAADVADDIDPVVRRVSGIVGKLLNVEAVGNEENFFLLGGHSLLGAQVVARIRDAFGVEMSLRTVFESPTVAGLAAAVDRLLMAAVDSLSEAEASRLLI
jgi:amino acid adenylation domain-containing protein